MNNIGQVKNAYLVSVIGVGLMVVMTAYNAVRAVMIRQMLQASTGAAGFVGRRQFGMNPFGLSNGLTIVALLVAVVGLVWLGLAIKKSQTASK